MENPLPRVLRFLKTIYLKAVRSIAYYPVLIGIGFCCLAITTLGIENWEVINMIKEKAPYVFISDINTANNILTTLVGSILSLTVFSFTMVMVVLSQASTNFSPRLLPELVSNRRHQLVLGFYVGTLIYCIIILISQGAYVTTYNTIGLSVTTAALSGVVCIILFVTFIHNISAAVQIQNIIRDLYEKANKKFEELRKTGDSNIIALQHVDYSDWYEIKSKKTGYYQKFEPQFLSTKLENKKVQVLSVNHIGKHIWEGETLFKTSEPMNEEEASMILLNCHISEELHDGDHPYLAMVKLMEIAVRAMSPGVNDPGTATNVIHKLGQLMALMVQLPKYTSKNIKPVGIVVINSNITTEVLLSTLIQPIRQYAKNDKRVMDALLEAIHYLKKIENTSEEDKEEIAKELKACCM